MRSVLDATCLLLAIIAFEAPYVTGHVSNLGYPCWQDQQEGQVSP